MMTTALENNKEMIQYRDDAEKLRAKSTEVAVITTPDDESRAIEFLSQIKRRVKIVEGKRKEYVVPLKEVIDRVNADFKHVTLPLDEAEVIIKRGLTNYRDSQEFKAKETARIEAEHNAMIAVGNLKRDMSLENMGKADEAGKVLVEANQEAPKNVAVQSGAGSYRKDWKSEVIDRKAVSPNFIEAVLLLAYEKGLYDQVARGFVKAGTREMPGLKIWEETVPIIRS